MMSLVQSKALVQVPADKTLLQTAAEREEFVQSFKQLKVEGMRSNLPLKIVPKVCYKGNKICVRLDMIQSPTSSYIEFFVMKPLQ